MRLSATTASAAGSKFEAPGPARSRAESESRAALLMSSRAMVSVVVVDVMVGVGITRYSATRLWIDQVSRRRKTEIGEKASKEEDGFAVVEWFNRDGSYEKSRCKFSSSADSGCGSARLSSVNGLPAGTIGIQPTGGNKC